MKINQDHETFEELRARRNSERELEQFENAITKLKSKIPSQLNVHSSHSNPHRHSWPNINNNINKSSNEMMHLVPKFVGTIDSDLLKDFLDVPRLQMYLLCFFLFPPEAVIKRWFWFPNGFQRDPISTRIGPMRP